LPAEQAVQIAVPTSGAKNPMAQLLQRDEPLELNLPIAQLEHSTVNAREYLPASHVAHVVALVWLFVCDPFKHSRHDPVNAWGAYLPYSQFTHSVVLKMY
jgi:hypothetical protein